MVDRVAFANPNPPAIRYITSLGQVEYSYWMAVDAAGFAYASGRTTTVFPPPCTLPILGPAESPGPYGFVTKIDPRGGVVWTVCLAIDSGRAIAVAADGAVYVAGESTVSKLSPDATRLVYSTIIPTTIIQALVVDNVAALTRWAQRRMGFQPRFEHISLLACQVPRIAAIPLSRN